MRKIVILVAATILQPAPQVWAARTPELQDIYAGTAECELSPALLQENLSKSYDAFDQAPDSTWRSMEVRGCYLSAAVLLDVYNLQHQNEFHHGEQLALYWHAGQMYACQTLALTAIARFESARDPIEPPQPDFRYNAYVDATIAFLKGDLKTLEVKRDEIALGTPSFNNTNLLLVNRLIRCFGQPYCLAYQSSSCD